MKRRVQEVGPASSVGPGWRSQGANIGTDAVVYPDPIELAKAFKDSLQGRRITPDLRGAWDQNADRQGASPEGKEEGWQWLLRAQENQAALATLAVIDAMYGNVDKCKETAGLKTIRTIESEWTPKEEDPAAIATLLKVFGESTSWSGYFVPMKQMLDLDPAGKSPINTPPSEPNKDPDLGVLGSLADVGKCGTPARTPKWKYKSVVKKNKTEDFNVFQVKTPSNPGVGNPRGQADLAQEPGYPFGTWSAKKVWEVAQKLILLYPEKGPADILGMAIEKSGVIHSELSPEDEQLLKMAVDFAQNGPARTNVRTGGTPGGPFRSADGPGVVGIT